MKTFLDKVWDVLVRWRTYIVNFLFVAVFTPDILLFMAGFNWGQIVPAKYMPYIILLQGLINVWMRPRPAARLRDPEVQYKRSTEGR